MTDPIELPLEPEPSPPPTASSFVIPQESIAGLPTIAFTFDGQNASAELAGAKMAAVARGPDRANMSILDAHSEALADILIRRVPTDENITESVLRIGSALLWSHARYIEAKAEGDAPNASQV